MSTSFFNDLGGGISSIFGGLGDLAEASAYSKASKIAASNAQIETRTGAINEMMASRKIYQSIGAEKAQTATAGFAASGSALDLLRSSVQQGALTKQLIANQTAITAQGYMQESAAYSGMATAAKAAGTGGIVGGLLQGAGALLSIFSDRRLKQDITEVGEFQPGIKLYRFRYLGQKTIYQGVMADEVEKVYPNAVVQDQYGFKMVHYGDIGLELMKVVYA